MRSILLGLVILLCGMVIGAGVALVCVQKIVVHAIHNPQETPGRIAERMKSKLKLTDEQTRQVKAILSERQKALHALRREWQPRVVQELDKTKEEVTKVLTPEQARAFRDRFDFLKKRWLPFLPSEVKTPE